MTGMEIELLGGCYKYDSTSTRLQFDRATTTGRPALRPQAYLFWAAILRLK